MDNREHIGASKLIPNTTDSLSTLAAAGNKRLTAPGLFGGRSVRRLIPTEDISANTRRKYGSSEYSGQPSEI